MSKTPIADRMLNRFTVKDEKLTLSESAVPWWVAVYPAKTEEEARTYCKRMGTSQCAMVCLQHSATFTRDGQCSEVRRVWMRPDK